MISRRKAMARQTKLRAVTAAQSRSYLAKAEEFLAGARSELDAGRAIAATSLAIHAGINAADAVTGARPGQRAAGQDHDQVLSLLRDAGSDGIALAKDLVRLLPLKTKAEYAADDIAISEAKRAVERTSRCVVVARTVLQGLA